MAMIMPIMRQAEIPLKRPISEELDRGNGAFCFGEVTPSGTTRGKIVHRPQHAALKTCPSLISKRPHVKDILVAIIQTLDISQKFPVEVETIPASRVFTLLTHRGSTPSQS